MKKLQKYRGLLISLVLAVITVVLIQQYISSLEREKTTGSESEQEKIKVVTANTDVPSGAILERDHLELKEIPKDHAHPEALLDKDDALDEVVTQDLVAQEVLLKTKVLDKQEQTEQMSHVVPQGKRAISISVDEVSGVSGFIQAGDQVDIVATSDVEEELAEKEIDKESEIILEELKVLAVGERIIHSQQELVQEVSTVTLSVNSEEATELTLAEEEKIIRLLLRPFANSQETE